MEVRRWDEERLEISFTTHTPSDPGGSRRQRDLVADEADVRSRRVAIVVG